MHASTFATGGTEAVVPGTGDVTHTFTNATASETFTLSQAATVRLLVVGGGGGGGRDCAGGGGGGGVIAVDSVVLPAGSYTVTVGAGGVGGTSGNGGIGGGNSKGGVGGNGGPGFESDIRGTVESFGAGGGAGAYGDNNTFNSQPGTGGDGLGGWGVPEPYTPSDTGIAERCAGRAGFGGGGGGGNNKVSNGAPGGSGCAIFRLSGVDPAVAAPTLAGAALESATPFDAVLSITLASPGAGVASADVFLQVAAEAASVASAAEVAATAGADGVFRATAAATRTSFPSRPASKRRRSPSPCIRRRTPAELSVRCSSRAASARSDSRWMSHLCVVR